MTEPSAHPTKPSIRRCAVYTRVSVDDRKGPSQENFRSTDAQFMACHELITSQLGNGWRASDRLYEDRGESGSHLKRPGLQKLLEDVRHGLIDVVVVHRFDRLTRHVGDLQTLLTLFEQHGVAVASVTEFINSDTQYGRLTLNLLTSFAQFERELIGERIRDKRAATRRQELWHGSAAPLGYVLVRQRLVMDPREASQVRLIFSGFVSQRSVTALLQDLTDRGIKTKRWHTKTGKARGGRPFDRNALYTLLNNRIYIGEFFYDNAWHKADHDPVVSPELWAQVHALMKSRARRTGVSSTPSDEHAFALKGLIVGADGRAMTPWLSSAYKGRRYAYYIPQREIASGAGKSGLPRLAANKIHAAVWDHLRTCLRDPEPWFKGLPSALTEHPTFSIPLIAERLRRLEAVIGWLFPMYKTRLLRQLIEKVTVDKHSFVIRVSLQGVFDLMRELLDESYIKALQSNHQTEDPIAG
ncbi:MAG: recombinase family protein [Betaproteobacteria bacterium]|nr:recombinase family protein [Betaproteobacteria bacterium]